MRNRVYAGRPGARFGSDPALGTPIAFSTAASTAASAGMAVAPFTVTCSSAAAALTVVGSLPGGVTFTDNGGGSGTLAGTAPAAGTYTWTFKAADGVNPDGTQAFTLTVT